MKKDYTKKVIDNTTSSTKFFMHVKDKINIDGVLYVAGSYPVTDDVYTRLSNSSFAKRGIIYFTRNG